MMRSIDAEEIAPVSVSFQESDSAKNESSTGIGRWPLVGAGFLLIRLELLTLKMSATRDSLEGWRLSHSVLGS